MSVNTFKLNGSGDYLKGSEISYSYSEDVSSLSPDDVSGGNGQVTLSVIGMDYSDDFMKHPALLVNNEMVLEDTQAGSVEFQVKKVSVNQELVSITGFTLESRMNVEKTAQPVGGAAGFEDTLQDAIEYYCGLVDVFPSFDDELLPYVSTRTVNFIGWQGNVWEKLKLLCASVSASATEDVPMEMIVDVSTLKFRIAKSRTAEVISGASSVTVDVDSFDAAKSVDVIMYKTEYKSNEVVNEDAPLDEELGFVQNVSIRDTLSVDAGQTIIKRFKINASLETVNNPIPVATISTFPYTGVTGEYVIVGNDDLPIQPAQWVGQGGSLTVSITENPNEIEIKITAPQADSLLQEGSSNLGFAPYKIGVESSGGQEYPAMYITGTGVFFERYTETFLTGASNDYTSDDAATEVDSPFITTRRELATRGVAAAQHIAGPNVSLNISSPSGVTIGNTLGSLIKYDKNQFRIESASYSQTGNSLKASPFASIASFNSIWNGKTFADFSATMGTDADLEYISFNEFTIIPLNEDI
jgi:hypothetical protein